MTITKDRVQLIAGRMFVIGIATVLAVSISKSTTEAVQHPFFLHRVLKFKL